MLVLGIVDESGVLNGATLGKAARLVSDIKGIENIEPVGVLSFTSVSRAVELTSGDFVELPAGDFDEDDVKSIADALAADSILGSRVISEDGTGLAVYIPLREKGDVNGVTSEVQGLLNVHGLAGGGNYLAGLKRSLGETCSSRWACWRPLLGCLSSC